MSKPKHKWIKIGNGYSKCTGCGIVKFERTKCDRIYLRNNIIVENTGCNLNYWASVSIDNKNE